MTPVALYQYITRFALFLMGAGTIWIAVFFVLIWLLHYELVQITPVPKSPRERIAWITITTTAGGFGMALAVTMEFPESISTAVAISGCIGALVALIYLAFVWTTVVELRRAVRLRRQQLRQQADEQQGMISDQSTSNWMG